MKTDQDRSSKKLFVLCAADEAGADHLGAAARRLGLGTLAPGASADLLEAHLAELLVAAGFPPDELTPAGWAAPLFQDFRGLASPFLDEFAASRDGARVVNGPSNVFFLDAWRALCAERAITVRFVHLRDFTGLAAGAAKPGLSLREFNAALLVVRQAGADVACFDTGDWQRAPELADPALAAALGADSASGALPAARLTSALRASPGPVGEGLPVELQAFARLFDGKHLGLPLMLSPGERAALQVVEQAAHPRGALAFWLAQGSPCAPVVAARAPVPVAVSPDEAWSEVVSRQRRQLRVLQSRIDEYESASAAPGERAAKPPRQRARAARKARAQPAAAPAHRPASASRHEAHAPEPTRSQRLWRKFRNDPGRYFADSKYRAVRAFGLFVRPK